MEVEKGFVLTIAVWKNCSKTLWFKQFAQDSVGRNPDRA